jgi:hypothetical protein
MRLPTRRSTFAGNARDEPPVGSGAALRGKPHSGTDEVPSSAWASAPYGEQERPHDNGHNHAQTSSTPMDGINTGKSSPA